jgi:hypothetical protein
MQHWGLGGQGEVGPVVDGEQFSVPLSGSGEDFEVTQFIASFEALLAQLHDVDSCAEHGVQEFGQVTLLGTAVGAEVQAGGRERGPWIGNHGLDATGADNRELEPVECLLRELGRPG